MNGSFLHTGTVFFLARFGVFLLPRGVCKIACRSCMRNRCITAVLVWLSGAVCALAQFGSFGDVPVEINADGNTRFEGGVAIAEDNVQIHYGDYSIYCDYAEYNPDTRDVLLVGNIRLYTPTEVLTGQRSLFNLETKQMRALEFSGAHFPMLFRAGSLKAPSMREFRVRDAVMTTDDVSNPDFHVKAKTVRIYPDSRVVFVNSTVYIGKVPIVWFPYLFANTTNSGYEFLPGYDSRWGAFLLSAYSFPIGTGGNLIGKVHADMRTEFGPAFGFDLGMQYGKENRSYGDFKSYYVFDRKDVDTISAPGEPKETRTTDRYRVSFTQRLFLTDDIYATADINLLSDVDFLEDFDPTGFRLDPSPDTYVGVTKWDEFYTLSLLARWQINDFQDTTERLPELALDIKQHRLFGLPVFYDGQTSVGNYRRMFSNEPSFGETEYPNYSSLRFDTFHQLSMPMQFFNWLNVTPRAGFRGTIYSKTGSFINTAGIQEVDPVSGEIQLLQQPTGQPNELNAPTQTLEEGGATFRPVVNLGVEVSTKFSKAYEKVQARWLGLDGLRHVVQPYVNYSFVQNFGDSPDEILPFDRFVPSTQLSPVNFPQFTAIDSIDSWSIMRVGVRNRLQTRRDSRTLQWLTLDTFIDLNFNNPYVDGSVSNLFNVVKIRPVNWFYLDLASQLPLVEEGFSEVNTGFNFMPQKDVFFRIGHRYIEGNDFFANNSQLDFYAYWRVNSNWGLSIYEQYEFNSQIFQYQRYMVHRDLSSWVASVGAQVRDNLGGSRDLGIVFMLSLKDAPQVTLPFAFDNATSPIEPGSNGN